MEGIIELDVLIYPDEVRLAAPEDIREWELETASQLSLPAAEAAEAAARLFVALYPYNPAAMSPNRDTAAEELPFVPGQIIKVIGDKDSDGFYHGESGGLCGFVPSNMVAEIPVDDGHVKNLLMQQGFIPVDHTGVCLTPDLSNSTSIIPDDVVVRRMVAIFDYDPWESSPNVDSEDELSFRAGDVIYVFGDMDQDGFYCVRSDCICNCGEVVSRIDFDAIFLSIQGDLHGRRGLVPSNFLQLLPWN